MIAIKDVKFTSKKYDYKKPFHITNSLRTSAVNVEIEIISSSGIIGRGEASPSLRVCGEDFNSVMSFGYKVREILKGRDVKNYRAISQEIRKKILSPSLKAALEFALIDCLCKEIGIGVWNFLGGVKKEIEIDKTVSIGSLDEMVSEASSIKKEGFKVIKIKVGENVDKDVEVMEEIYKKTKGVKYIVDANMGYSKKDAVYFISKLYSKGIDISVFEQPVNKDDIDGLKYVRLKSNYPVAADESVRSVNDALNVINQNAVDLINIKLMKTGFLDAISIIHLAHAYGVKLMIGCMSESSLGINQSVQLACGFGCFEFCDLDSHLLIKEEKKRGDFVQKKNLIRVI